MICNLTPSQAWTPVLNILIWPFLRRSATSSSDEEDNSEPILPPNPKRRVPLVFYSSSEDSENDTNRGNQQRTNASENRSPLARVKTKWNPNQTTGSTFRDRIGVWPPSGRVVYFLWIDASVPICSLTFYVCTKALFRRLHLRPEQPLMLATPAGKC